jgi:hypothetical protein
MIKESHLHPDVAAETYESLMTLPGGYEKDASFDLEGFKSVLKLGADIPLLQRNTTMLLTTSRLLRS